jgi:hypothetical protein
MLSSLQAAAEASLLCCLYRLNCKTAPGANPVIARAHVSVLQKRGGL